MPTAEDLHGNSLNENNNIKEGQVFWFYTKEIDDFEFSEYRNIKASYTI